jgi:signal transduction histidine kinase
MRPYDSRGLSKAYLWASSSVLRVMVSTLVISALLVAAALAFSPIVFGFVSLVILSAVGLIAYRVRHSEAVLDYPGIDRFFQQVPCYLSILNKDLRIIRTNRLFREDFGDRVGEKCHVVYKGTDEVCTDCPVIKTFADGQMHKVERTVTTKDGAKGQMIVYTKPVTDHLGDIIGVMEMATNITEIKELQEQIRAGRREYMNLFERVPCYISIQDKNFRIQRVNRLFRQDLGDGTGKLCYEVYKGLDTVCPDCHVAKTIQDGEIHNSEKTVIRRDGTAARLIVYSSPIFDERGDMTAVMEMATDITEVKRLQRELAYMGRTIAVMAHRIKNILMGLEGGIFVVNTGMEDGDDAMVKQGWEMIQRNVKNVSSIVKDLLYCSREREMSFQQIDPVPVVRSVFDLFEGRARKEGIGFSVDIPEALPEGRFDPDALHSMLTNLVTNALDACVNDAGESKDSHRIRIRGGCREDGGYVFEVEDNGAGIPGAVGECIFEDFFTTKGREGTGLGLLVAQRVVEEHGGTITFWSREGEGTVFRAIFPEVTEGELPDTASTDSC